MIRPQALSRRALLSAGGGCFAGSFLLDSWLFDAAAAGSGGSVWQQRWGDATQRKFTSAAPDPDELTVSWSVGLDDSLALTVECVGPDLVYGSDYDRILAYSRADGTRQWSYAAHEGSLSLPSLVGDTLLVQENATVHAIAASDGSARWTGEFAPSSQPFATLVALDGDAYIPGQRSYFEIDPSTGFQRRSFDVKTLGTLVAASGDQLFWWADGRLRVTDTTGATQWSESLGRSHPPSGRAIAVTDSEVVLRHLSAADGPMVTALDRASGDRVWSISQRIDGGVAVTAGPETVYIGTNRELLAVDRASGDSRWTVSVGGATPQPVAAPGMAYVPTTGGLVPVDSATGDQSGHRLLAGQTVRSLAVVSGSIYAITEDALVALEVNP